MSLKRFLFVFFFVGGFENSYTQTVKTYTSSKTWTCPAGVTSVQVECWGGGVADADTEINGYAVSTNKVVDYELIDANFINGINYYRLVKTN